jgi:Trp operon repressor
MADVKKMITYILSTGELNQKELASKLDVSPAQVTRWLDDSEPRLNNYQKIEKIYKELAK